MITNQSNNDVMNNIKMADLFSRFNNCVYTYCNYTPNIFRD